MCVCVCVFGEWPVVFGEVLFRACVMVDLAHVSPCLNLCGLRRYFLCFFACSVSPLFYVFVGLSNFGVFFVCLFGSSREIFPF